VRESEREREGGGGGSNLIRNLLLLMVDACERESECVREREGRGG